ncbi:MAG: alpha/beta hydrolase fold domain-containing protein, partial [Clostridia bacterium]|nr:alpha/beta hydrolase fold domain-containing protein [Clostridia bacterium]
STDAKKRRELTISSIDGDAEVKKYPINYGSKLKVQEGDLETTGDEAGVVYLHDVEYARPGGTPLHLQIFIPTSRNRPFAFMDKTQTFALPCFVFVQGSGWFPQYVYAETAQIVRLAARGYVCAIVEYRHAGIAPFPAQIRDARNAVRFLKANAARFAVDPDRMILAGSSSGGHTALFGGILEDDDSQENLFPGVSARVRGLVDYFGSTSFIAPDSNPHTVNHNLPDSPEGRVMGGRDLRAHPELARQLSVECNIERDTPIAPVLIFHGTKDRTVNCSCSAVLYERLKETGHEAAFYLIRGGDHGGPEFWTEPVIDIVDRFCRKCFGEETAE